LSRTSVAYLLSTAIGSALAVPACSPFESNRKFDTTGVRTIKIIGDRQETFSDAVSVITWPSSVLNESPPPIDSQECSISGNDINDVDVQVRGDTIDIDIRGSENVVAMTCTILDLAMVEAIDIGVRLSIQPGVERLEMVRIVRDSLRVLPWVDLAEIRYSLVDAHVTVESSSAEPVVEIVAERSSIRLDRMRLLDATLVDSRVGRGAYVEEEANLDLSASVVENLCAPGELVVRAAQGSSVTYDCDPDVLDVDADETSDIQPEP
jgi:hypothetical protein